MSLVSSLKHSLWRILTERMHLDYTLRSGIRVMIRNYADWCTYNDLFVNGEYRQAIDDAIAEWRSENSVPMCVLDLGGNTGFFTLQMADTFLQKSTDGKLVIRPVEASRQVAEELQRRLVIPSDRVDAKILNGLVGKREGSARLNFGKEDTVNFVGESGDGEQWVDKRGSTTVSYVDLDAVAASMPTIHLIKCDIEGSEFDFLDTYPELLRKTRRIAIEFHSAFGDIAKAVERLKGMGFSSVTTLRESTQTPTIYFARQ